MNPLQRKLEKRLNRIEKTISRHRYKNVEREVAIFFEQVFQTKEATMKAAYIQEHPEDPLDWKAHSAINSAILTEPTHYPIEELSDQAIAWVKHMYPLAAEMHETHFCYELPGWALQVLILAEELGIAEK